MGIEVAIFGAMLASTAVQVKQSKTAQAAQEKAQQIDTKRQEFQMAREKRKQIRQARSVQAEIQATSFAQGTAQTSKTAGISGGVSREMGSNIGFLNQSQGFVQAIGQQNLVSTRAQAKSARAGAYGQLAAAGMSAYGNRSNAPQGGVEGPPQPGLFG